MDGVLSYLSLVLDGYVDRNGKLVNKISTWGSMGVRQKCDGGVTFALSSPFLHVVVHQPFFCLRLLLNVDHESFPATGCVNARFFGTARGLNTPAFRRPVPSGLDSHFAP
jgi:hypothetical protein